jgi:hypothetical protein
VQKSSGADVDVKIGFNFNKAELTVPASTDGYGLYYSADGTTYAALTIVPSLAEGVMSFSVPKVADGYYLLSAGPVTGINSINDISENLMVYPNPAENYTRLVINNQIQGKFTVQLYNSTGSVVRTINSNKMAGMHSEEISTAELVPGLYLLHVQQGNERGVLRLLKK